jgi:hypothetical protein
LKNLNFSQKSSRFKIEAKEGVKEISVMLKKKPSTFNQNNRKDALKASQELARLPIKG